MKRIHFGLMGAGGFAREVMPYVRASVSKSINCSSEEIELYFVETWEPKVSTVNGYPLVSLTDFSKLPGHKYFNVAVSDGRAREELVQAVGGSAEVIQIHAPQAVILEANEIADGSILCPFTAVTSNIRIGRYFQANFNAIVGHDCVIGDFVTLAPSVNCLGRVHIGDYAYIGTNAMIRQGAADKPLRIGTGAIVGMGAVVTKDVPDGATVIGNPARVMSK
ncbi:acetyltransferase [Zhongshania sp.]|uniref:acetyltransferase n=1 Tax=Zhongshania sp. TaxID=1971902 RepID=UPI0035621A1C